MKNAVHKTAHRLLEILYMQDIDHPAFEALTLSHKSDAIELLIADGLVFENEIYLPTDKLYCYYSITAKGEEQIESDGFKPKRKISSTAYALIMVAVLAVVIGFAMFLIMLWLDFK
ncbi:MAG: hypothetical protein WC756_11495 [Taibaiella sp.]|jgi:hypothetical protein